MQRGLPKVQGSLGCKARLSYSHSKIKSYFRLFGTHCLCRQMILVEISWKALLVNLSVRKVLKLPNIPSLAGKPPSQWVQEKWMGEADQTFQFSSTCHKPNFFKPSSELFCGFIVHISILIIFIFFFTWVTINEIVKHGNTEYHEDLKVIWFLENRACQHPQSSTLR